jgi:RNA polymerase subunit RPABC4/transcription elongation factor Spt4
MKVKNALVCCDCDEVHTSEACPQCGNRFSWKLRSIIGPLDEISKAKGKDNNEPSEKSLPADA